MLTRQAMNFVKAKCQENNVRLTPETAIHAYIQYIKETTEGKIEILKELEFNKTFTELMIDALGCTVMPVDYKKRYIVAEQKVFNSEDVVEFRGYLVQGYAAPHGSVYAERYDLPQCDSCGTSCPSTAMADSIHEGIEKVMCNHCRTYRDDIESSKVGSISICQKCTKYDCSNHDKNNYLVQRSHETNQRIGQFNFQQVK